MKSFLNKLLGLLLLSVATLSHAGTYDGSWYTDQQRATMVNNYANAVNSYGYNASTNTNVYGIESVVKYNDTRLMNGKKGYIGSILVTKSDAYLSTSAGSSYAKETIVHLFDYSVVGKYNATSTSPGTDCRTFTSPTRSACWGDAASPNNGLVGLTEVKTKNKTSTKTLAIQYQQEMYLYDKMYYTVYKQAGGTTKQPLYTNFSTNFVDSTIESGLIYNALQNADGTFPTKEVLTPPMDYTVVLDPLVPVVVAPIVTQDCSNPNASNTTNSSICLIGQVIEGCKLTTGNYLTTINTVAGNVGLTAVDVKITCSTGTPFHIKPIHDNIQLAGDDETLRLTGWKDNGRADKLTPLSAKVINGTGAEMSIPIYFTLEGKGKSGIYGNSVVNKYTGSAVYPIQIVY